MTTTVAFLRAINVAGHAAIRMQDLRRIFEAAGGEDVRTHIQSGNVLFRCAPAREAAMRRRAERGLADFLGQGVTVVYRTVRDLQRLLASDPFGGAAAGPDVKLYAGFLAGPPKRKPKLPLTLPKEGLEITRVTRSEVFVVSRRVRGRFGFPNAFLEEALGVSATTRNWNTVTKIVAMAAGPRAAEGG